MLRNVIEMKSLIRKILTENNNQKIIDKLKGKFNFKDFEGIKDYLDALGYSKKEISEIFGEWFKMETGVELTPSNWMNKKFSPDQLEIVTSKKYPGSIFFIKDGFVVMEQDKKYQDFYFDYDEIWSFFESVFGMEYQQIEEVLSYWLEETLKLKDYTPFTNLSSGADESWWRLSN